MTDEEREKYGLPPLPKPKPKPKPEDYINPKADPDFAAKLREEWERRGMSINKFALYLGIEHKTLANIEKCRRKPKKPTRDHICDVLGWEKGE